MFIYFIVFIKIQFIFNLIYQTKYGSKYNGPTTYILDSEPDDDDSDDETKPKHIIPYWAQCKYILFK